MDNREWWIKEEFIGQETGIRYPAIVKTEKYDYEKDVIHVIPKSVADEREKRLVEALRKIEDIAYNTIGRNPTKIWEICKQALKEIV